MKFKATKEQLQTVAMLAVNASEPVGLGILHYQKKKYQKEDFEEYFATTNDNYPIQMDYVGGRMVKLYIQKQREGKDMFSIANKPPDVEYQSWAKTYPTYQDLLKASGIVDFYEDVTDSPVV